MPMKRLVVILLLILFVLPVDSVSAQVRSMRVRGVRTVRWEVTPAGDSVLHITLLPVNIYHRKRDMKEYQRMIKAVKKVYPLAVEAARRMENLDARLAEMERKKDRKGYTKAIEEALKREITPMLLKMTRYEGKILMKLIDRETEHTVYNIIKEFRSGFTAGFYQMIARLFGNNLKTKYDPEGDDAMLEQIVKYYKAGLL